jgi:UDP-N-acetylmuramyl pentapeptide phosphotransferase/UDP-N-acetylglucosamine-1-phosphate transferase
MKTIKTLFLLIVLVFISSSAVLGHPSRYPHNHHANSTGAPLDGGILSVLGVAGVAYYAARKKKKNNPAV